MELIINNNVNSDNFHEFILQRNGKHEESGGKNSVHHSYVPTTVFVIGAMPILSVLYSNPNPRR